MGCSSGWDYSFRAPTPKITPMAPDDPLVKETEWEITRSRTVTARTPEEALKKALTTPIAEEDETWTVRKSRRG